MIRRGDGWFELEYEVYHGNRKEVSRLLRSGCLKHYNDMDIAEIAARNGDYEILQELLVYNVNLKPKSRNYTIIETCALYGNDKRCIFLLIRNGVTFDHPSIRLSERVTQEMRDAIVQRLECKKKTILLLGIKKKRGVLRRFDRFLIREIALEMWRDR